MDTLTENQSISGNFDALNEVFLPMLLLELVQKKTPPQVRKHCEGEENLCFDILLDDQALYICAQRSNCLYHVQTACPSLRIQREGLNSLIAMYGTRFDKLALCIANSNGYIRRALEAHWQLCIAGSWVRMNVSYSDVRFKLFLSYDVNLISFVGLEETEIINGPSSFVDGFI